MRAFLSDRIKLFRVRRIQRKRVQVIGQISLSALCILVPCGVAIWAAGIDFVASAGFRSSFTCSSLRKVVQNLTERTLPVIHSKPLLRPLVITKKPLVDAVNLVWFSTALQVLHYDMIISNFKSKKNEIVSPSLGKSRSFGCASQTTSYYATTILKLQVAA